MANWATREVIEQNKDAIIQWYRNDARKHEISSGLFGTSKSSESQNTLINDFAKQQFKKMDDKKEKDWAKQQKDLAKDREEFLRRADRVSMRI